MGVTDLEILQEGVPRFGQIHLLEGAGLDGVKLTIIVAQ